MIFFAVARPFYFLRCSSGAHQDSSPMEIFFPLGEIIPSPIPGC